MSKKNNKKSTTRKSTQSTSNVKKKVSSGYVSRRVPTGMTQIGVADDGTIVYSGTPQVLQQYWPDLYSLRPGASGYVFTGRNGVYTPIGKSNHAYDKIIANQRTSNNLLSQDNLQYVANSGDTSRLPKGYTVKRIPIQTGYGGLTHGWAVYDPNNREVTRSNNISYNTQDPADNVLNYAMAGIPAIARYGVTALGSEIAKGVGTAGRAMTPSSYFQTGLPLANAAKAVGLNPTTTGLTLDALYTVPAGIAINNAANTWQDSNASLDDKIANTGEAILWNLPFINAEKRAINAAGNVARSLRTYPTSNGKVFGFNIGDYAVGLDARGVNAYGGLPVRGGKVNTIRINGNRNVLTNDEVNSLVNGSGLKVNGNTIKNVSVDYTNGIVRGKFGGKDVEFYIGEEPVFNEEKGVIITNPQGRYDLGSDLKKAYEIKLGPEAEGRPTVFINGNRYTATDPNIQDMEVRFTDSDNLSYQGPLRKVITRMGIQPRATITTSTQEVMPVNTPDLRPAEESSLLLEQPVAEGATPEEIVAVQNTASGTPEVKPVETPVEPVAAEQPVVQPKPKRQRKTTPRAEKITIDNIEYTAKRKVDQGKVRYELTDENGDTFTIPEWYYNKYANSGHNVQSRIRDRKLTNNLETISGEETEMIDQVIYKGKPYDVIRNRDFTSTLHNPDTNESITMTDLQVLDEIVKGNLKNPTYTEPMKAKTLKSFDNRYDEIWGGANQNTPTRMNVADRKRITLRDRYNNRLETNSWQRIPKAVKVWSGLGIGVPAVTATIAGLSGRNSGTSNIGPDGFDTTKYVKDYMTGDILLKSVADSIRKANMLNVQTMNNNVDTTKRVQNTTTQSDQESSMGNAGNLNLNNQSTIVPTGDADTIPVDENHYMLRSDPGVLYNY